MFRLSGDGGFPFDTPVIPGLLCFGQGAGVGLWPCCLDEYDFLMFKRSAKGAIVAITKL